MKQASHLFCIPLFFLSLLLTACFQDTITEFEDCVPEVTLVSTEATPTMELIQGNSGWDNFKLGREDYHVYLNLFGNPLPDGIKSTSLLTGTKVNLDGYAAAQSKMPVTILLYFRGDIEGQTVWMTHRDAQKLTDPANEDSLQKLGLLDEAGREVVYANWECSVKQ